jgi:hypothetical protein
MDPTLGFEPRTCCLASQPVVDVEIRRPDTDLINGERRRNGAWRASGDLADGIARLQANCEQ